MQEEKRAMLPKYTPRTQSLPTSNMPTMAMNPMVRMTAPPGTIPHGIMPGHQPLMNVQVPVPSGFQHVPRPLMGNPPGFLPQQQQPGLFNMPPRGGPGLLPQPQGLPLNPALRMQQQGIMPGNLFAQRMLMGGPRPR